jgi:hypothetical protein
MIDRCPDERRRGDAGNGQRVQTMKHARSHHDEGRSQVVGTSEAQFCKEALAILSSKPLQFY